MEQQEFREFMSALSGDLPGDGRVYAGQEEIEALGQRLVQVYVPGRQMTLAHLIAGPSPIIYEKLSLEPEKEKRGEWAIGIMKFTPWESAFIAADVAQDASAVRIGFIDRFMGCLVVTGTKGNVEAALEAAREYCRDVLGFAVCKLTAS